VVLEITNHDRNLQIPIDDLAAGFNATVTWSKAKTSAHHGHHHGGDRHDAAATHTRSTQRFTHGGGAYWS